MQVFTRDEVECFNSFFPGPYRCSWDAYEEAKSLIVIPKSAVVEDAARVLRNPETQPAKFRRYTRVIRDELYPAAFKDLPLQKVQTPTVHLAKNGRPIMCPTGKLSSDILDFVVIWRAGEALLNRELFPKSRVAYYGLTREHRAPFRPRLYARKLPPNIRGRDMSVLDPMLATGGSDEYVIRDLRKLGVDRIMVVCIFAAVKGVLRLKRTFPDITIIGATLDPILNQDAYIVPGCGDFGDRYNGTTNDALSPTV